MGMGGMGMGMGGMGMGMGMGGMGGMNQMGAMGKGGMMQGGMRPGMMPGMQGMQGKGGAGAMGGMKGAMGGKGMQMGGQMGAMKGMGAMGGKPQMPMQQMPQMQQGGARPESDPNAPLTAAALASAPPGMQKQMLGEKLFPLISRMHPELSGKITGMMLEMDNAELLILLESPGQMKAKIDEALRVIQSSSR